MIWNSLSLAATILLLFPMIYFMVTSPAFFLRPLEHPGTRFLLRGLFAVVFLAVSIIAGIGSLAFANAGRYGFALGMGAIALLAVAARRLFLRGIDRQDRAIEAGEANAASRLRRLHLEGIAYNAAQLVAVIATASAAFPKGI